jgi:hypothetical protein
VKVEKLRLRRLYIEHEEKGEIAKLGSVVETQAGEHAPEMVKAGEVSDE